MFSVIVASITFVITTLILLLWFYDEFIRQKGPLELALLAQDQYRINWVNVLAVIGLWIGSGVYLWG